MYTYKKVTHYFHTLRDGLARGASKHKECESLTRRKWPGTASIYVGILRETIKSLLFHFHFHFIYGATAPSGSCPPLRRCLHSSLSPAHRFHPHIPTICDMSLWMTSSHLVLGFTTGLVL